MVITRNSVRSGCFNQVTSLALMPSPGVCVSMCSAPDGLFYYYNTTCNFLKGLKWRTGKFM